MRCAWTQFFDQVDLLSIPYTVWLHYGFGLLHLDGGDDHLTSVIAHFSIEEYLVKPENADLKK